MLICRNAKGVHGHRKVGNPCPKSSHSGAVMLTTSVIFLTSQGLPFELFVSTVIIELHRTILDSQSTVNAASCEQSNWQPAATQDAFVIAREDIIRWDEG